MRADRVADGWCYSHNGETYGPVSPAQLKGLLVSGLISPRQSVWKPGEESQPCITATAAVLSSAAEAFAPRLQPALVR